MADLMYWSGFFMILVDLSDHRGKGGHLKGFRIIRKKIGVESGFFQNRPIFRKCALSGPYRVGRSPWL